MYQVILIYIIDIFKLYSYIDCFEGGGQIDPLLLQKNLPSKIPALLGLKTVFINCY